MHFSFVSFPAYVILLEFRNKSGKHSLINAKKTRSGVETERVCDFVDKRNRLINVWRTGKLYGLF